MGFVCRCTSSIWKYGLSVPPREVEHAAPHLGLGPMALDFLPKLIDLGEHISSRAG